MSDPKSRPPGAYALNGRLFFKLLDGSSISCNCIRDDFADAIVALFKNVSCAGVGAPEHPKGDPADNAGSAGARGNRKGLSECH